MLLVEADEPGRGGEPRPPDRRAEVPLHGARRPRGALPRLRAERAVPARLTARRSAARAHLRGPSRSPRASHDPHVRFARDSSASPRFRPDRRGDSLGPRGGRDAEVRDRSRTRVRHGRRCPSTATAGAASPAQVQGQGHRHADPRRATASRSTARSRSPRSVRSRSTARARRTAGHVAFTTTFTGAERRHA